MPTHKLRTAREVGMQNAEQMARADAAKAAIMKMESIAGQQWVNDRAFKMRLNSGKERGFTDMPDYVTKSSAYYAYITKRRKVGDAGKGERKAPKFIIGAALKRTLPLVGLVFLFLLIPGIIKGTQAAIYSNDKNVPHVFSATTAVPTQDPRATPPHSPTVVPVTTPVDSGTTGIVITGDRDIDGKLFAGGLLLIGVAISGLYIYRSSRNGYISTPPRPSSRRGRNKRDIDSGTDSGGSDSDDGTGALVIAPVAQEPDGGAQMIEEPPAPTPVDTTPLEDSKSVVYTTPEPVKHESTPQSQEAPVKRRLPPLRYTP